MCHFGTPDFGDLIGSDSDDDDNRWDIEENCEEENRYSQTESYYPVHIGEIIVQKYLIEHKFGNGGFSTVWMVHDLQQGKNVALKINTAGGKGPQEYYMNTEIARLVRNISNLLLCHGEFCLPGPCGNHTILVFPLRGPSVGSYFKKVSMRSRMFAARQLLQALVSLHGGGFVHRGEYMLYDIASFDDCDLETKYRYLGRPQRHPLSSKLWKAGELVEPMQVPRNMLRGTVFLGDFGQAIRAGTSIGFKLQGPFEYCAPERFHDVDPSPASDMWSYMCMFPELYLGFPPFQGSGNGYTSTMKTMIIRLGPLPEQWKERYHDASRRDVSWYDKRRTATPGIDLEAIVHRFRSDPSLSERSDVISLMAKGLATSIKIE